VDGNFDPSILMRILLACLTLTSLAGAKPKQPPPVAVEARFKERISTKLRSALDKGTDHLAWILGVRSVDDKPVAGNAKNTFGRYELDLNDQQTWRKSCEEDVNVEGDSMVLCVIHKLQALTALCQVEGAAAKYRVGVMVLVKQLLGKRDVIVPGLGVKRSLLPIASGLEAWLYETKPHSGKYDVSVEVQAAAMLSLVQCASALGEKDLLKDIQSWFLAVEKMYPRKNWDKRSFHSNSILWESFALISTTIRQDSSFAQEIHDFVSDFESYQQAAFAQDPKVWSFSGANAAVISWSAEKKSARKQRLGHAVDQYMKRWKINISPNLNTSLVYTCGPLQGLAPLLLKRGADAAELVSSVLGLAEKDVDLFQISTSDGEKSIAAQRIGEKILDARGQTLEGAFLRDEAQLRSEERRSLRIDDTAQCVIALTRTLKLVEDLQGVEVPEDAIGDLNRGEL